MINLGDGRKIIVSADDFNISELSNKNILAVLRLGKIDRLAVMIDGLRLPTAEERDEILKSGVKIDIHLNAIQKITENRKLSEPILPRLISFLFRFLGGGIRTAKMEEKWRREIEEFRKIFGKSPDGISAHQHVHFFPSYFRATIRLAREFKIPYIRFGKRGIISSSNNVSRIISFLDQKDKKIFRESGLESSDFWASLDWFGSAEELRKNIPAGETEVVCHPERIEELEMLKKYF